MAGGRLGHRSVRPHRRRPNRFGPRWQPRYDSRMDPSGFKLRRGRSGMDILLLLKAVVLGIVEGATEFIPVSSTGHLIIVGDWLDFTGPLASTFHVFIQLGAILAIVWLYRATFVDVLRRAHREPGPRRFVRNIILGTIPAGIVGFLTYDWIMTHLFSPVTVAGALVVGGLIILLIEWWVPRARVDRVSDASAMLALGVGMAQILALFPGTSRSGATIMGAYAMGMSRTSATEFSFFLAVPIMVAATAYDLLAVWQEFTMETAIVFAVGFVVSFLAAVVVVKAFLRFVSNHTFRVFAWYRIALGALILAWYGFSW
jgi:undecaprenyl-diphosphatase